MARTRKAPKRRRAKVSLPSLHVGIYDGKGKLVRVELFDDPRVAFCNVYNDRTLGKAGYTARPILRKQKGAAYALALLGDAKRKGGAR